MTPKEKAKKWEEAKTCALVAVDEILKTINDTFQGFLDADLVAYWEEVKQEIEKL